MVRFDQRYVAQLNEIIGAQFIV